ncbi:uracil-DNA glycosylase [Patescibacteria group bacterium]|nr:uracil-DNA glycosylase [Patescibacteria group bacterium]MBU1868602.1 uracil-DNA glycosylase [Patescibacteria group bacterium]
MPEKREQLNSITKEISTCRKCPLYQFATNSVPGEGNASAEIVFVGEAPGYYEDQQGRPFVGRAGRLLEQSLDSIGLNREEVFISNVLHHRPPSNRDPLPDEVTACKLFMLRQLEVIQPKILATLGRFAMNVFLPEAKISRDHGKMKKVDDYDFIVFPLYHPAAALRSGSILSDFREDFDRLGKLLKLQSAELNLMKKQEGIDESSKMEQMGLRL